MQLSSALTFLNVPSELEKRSALHIRISQLSRYPALKKFEQTVPIPKAYAALGAFGIFTLVSSSKSKRRSTARNHETRQAAQNLSIQALGDGIAQHRRRT